MDTPKKNEHVDLVRRCVTGIGKLSNEMGYELGDITLFKEKHPEKWAEVLKAQDEVDKGCIEAVPIAEMKKVCLKYYRMWEALIKMAKEERNA